MDEDQNLLLQDGAPHDGLEVGRAMAEEEIPKVWWEKESGSPDSLVSSKWKRLKSIGCRTGEPGGRGHMSARHKPCISTMKGIQEAGPELRLNFYVRL